MPHRPAATRRTAIGATLGALLVATGCDLDDLDPRGGPVPAGSPTAPPVDADTALVAEVVADLDATIAALPHARSLGDLPDALIALHLTHRAALTDDPAPAPGTGGRRLAYAPALRRVRTLERAHQGRLDDACLAAGSGALASLLASMSAAVAQRLASVSTAVPR
ncbi:hypothetical protein [Nocardioides sp. cx-173]|uniref:hypothetical protein n=1 Tax=Nocardioides sp. cx-173 TaxID=2898796 RepID=UPI001E2B07DC|nr:hypothetical protein [Nocardioides sp. cx-173]MCD4524876.1 hypothetical protein [Nocardioides sp. cx-173]UGB43379.1 hypothetical protein LQ940_07580 [Nocardioides sp. cx-173]